LNTTIGNPFLVVAIHASTNSLVDEVSDKSLLSFRGGLMSSLGDLGTKISSVETAIDSLERSIRLK